MRYSETEPWAEGQMIAPEVTPENDRRVWVRGANGVECVKWLSKIQLRTDLQILGPYLTPEEEAEREALLAGPAYSVTVDEPKVAAPPEPEPELPKKAPAKKAPVKRKTTTKAEA